MPLYFWLIVGVAAAIVIMIVRVATAVIEAPASASGPIAIDGKAVRLEGTRYIEYRVGVAIEAAPEAIWKLLTDANRFPEWNSTVIGIEGTIALGERIQLRAKVAPDRTFPLTVATFDASKKMVWQDGNRIFKGVRTFTLSANGGTTDVTMAEVLTGAMLPMIAPKLPDFRPGFDAFAADLKKAAES